MRGLWSGRRSRKHRASESTSASCCSDERGARLITGESQLASEIAVEVLSSWQALHNALAGCSRLASPLGEKEPSHHTKVETLLSNS